MLAISKELRTTAAAGTARSLASNATSGVASGSLGVSGRKNVGRAESVLQLESGAVQSYKVKPQDLGTANTRVTAFSTYANQLAREHGKTS